MANILHFGIDGDAKTACGTRIVLCDDYTDQQAHVECKRCRRTEFFKNYDPARFNVDVWNHEGDVIRWFRSVTPEEVEDIRREYADNPTAIVSVEEI